MQITLREGDFNPMLTQNSINCGINLMLHTQSFVEGIDKRTYFEVKRTIAKINEVHRRRRLFEYVIIGLHNLKQQFLHQRCIAAIGNANFYQ